MTSTSVRGLDLHGFSPAGILAAAHAVRDTVHVVRHSSTRELGVAGAPPTPEHQHLGTLPPIYPEWLGDRGFCAAHGTRFGYVVGEMANGIATIDMVVAAAEAGLLGVYGAAGQSASTVRAAARELAARLPGRTNWGVNLIHSPAEPGVEEQTAKQLIELGVPQVSASAFLELTPAVVLCAVAGLHTEDGRIVRPRRLLAKVSRPEVARLFLQPAPAGILRDLIGRGLITTTEAELAARVPVAEAITVEGDSAGHTDNRPLVALLPTMLQVRDATVARHRYEQPVRIGAAGGLGTPHGVAAAFALGAAYVVTGSVNQAAVESALSAPAKRLLSEAGIADVTMAPSADMFEMGVKVQVLRRGSLFAARATHLLELYREYQSIADIPPAIIARLERDVFRRPVAAVWQSTREFWRQREPAEADRAEHDARHQMALVFRWYLGMSSRWAIDGAAGRVADFQIWCGPALGAFNAWTAGSYLAQPENRTVAQIALNLLEGAAVVTRAHQLRTFGVPVPDGAFTYTPRLLA